MSEFYVYALFRDDGRIFYIGKGKGNRWADHFLPSYLRARSPKSSIIHEMRSRGAETIKVKLHEGLSEATAHDYEIALIAAIGRRPNGPLANLTDGGDGASGVSQSSETRAKRSAASRGKKRSPETRAKMSAAARGRSSETRAKISAAHLGKPRSAATRAKISASQRGRKLSTEHRANMSIAIRGRKQSAEHVAKRVASRRDSTRICNNQPELF